MKRSLRDAAALFAACCAVNTSLGCRSRTNVVVEENAARFDKVVYEVAHIYLPDTLTVLRMGKARYESHTNMDRLAHAEMGIYETTLPSSAMDGLQATLSESIFQPLPDHWGRVRSGDRHRRIKLFVEGRVMDKAIGTLEPVDPGLKRVVEHLDGVAKTVLASPRSVLRLALSNVGVDTHRALTVSLEFSNPGTEPVACLAPNAILAGADGALAVITWPATQVQDQLRVAVGQVEEVARESGSAVEGRILRLMPGRSAHFRITAVLVGTRSGDAVVRVTYASPTPLVGGVEVLTGELVTTAKTAVP